MIILFSLHLRLRESPIAELCDRLVSAASLVTRSALSDNKEGKII
jgi:hypothetical protein